MRNIDGLTPAQARYLLGWHLSGGNVGWKGRVWPGARLLALGYLCGGGPGVPMEITAAGRAWCDRNHAHVTVDIPE